MSTQSRWVEIGARNGIEMTAAQKKMLADEAKKGKQLCREAELFTAWLLGAAACKTGQPMKSNPHEVNRAEWRAWGRGFRAWERDQKHRK